MSVLPEQPDRQDPLMMQTFTQRPRKIGNSPNILVLDFDRKKVVKPKDQQIPQHFRCIEYALETALDGAVQEVPWQKEGQDLTFLTQCHPDCNFCGIRFLENRLSDLKTLRSLPGQFFCSGGTTRCQITKTPLHGFEPMELNLLRSEFELKIQTPSVSQVGARKTTGDIYIRFIYYLYNLYDLIFAIWSFMLLTEAKAPLHLRILPSILC